LRQPERLCERETQVTFLFVLSLFSFLLFFFFFSSFFSFFLFSRYKTSSSSSFICHFPDDKATLQKYTPLAKAVRIHANFLEQVVLNLFLITILELNKGHHYLVHGLALALLTGRILHAEFGLNASNSLGFGRATGTTLSLGVTGVSSAANIYLGYLALF